ncbi:MAG TPA: hypothetical protein VEI06_08985 [Gemmatimonadaceae bacterium]|nr:hypothetical protein [Gemmatimonadaceae bacterium]
MARLSPSEYDALERALTDGSRVVITRRGSEFVVALVRLELSAGRERLDALHPTTGEPIAFYIDDVDSIEVIR